jgi:hypothetical protein
MFQKAGGAYQLVALFAIKFDFFFCVDSALEWYKHQAS